MVSCNTTLEDADVSDVDLAIGITFHHLGLIITAAAGSVAILIATYLIVQHAIHYRRPWEQKHIIRILFMIPVYAVVSFLSYLFYKHAIYFEVIRDCYEAFAIASFFTLLCHYVAPTLHDQKEHFRTLKPVNWIWPVTWFQKCSGGQDRGLLRRPMSGLTWFNIIYLGVFQYCLVRVFFTIVSVASQAADRYCEASLNPAFAHIWVLLFEASSVSIAMYTLIQFYVQLRKDLADKQPFLKLLCIKLVIFFSFWQTLLVSFLSSSKGPLQPTEKFAYPDIKVGIPSMLLCIEMAIFAVLHLFAFPWRKPYGRQSGGPDEGPYLGGSFGWKAYADAFNPWDILKATARGLRWLFVGRRTRKQDISYQNTSSGWGGDGAFAGDYEQYHSKTHPPATNLQTFNYPPVPPVPYQAGPNTYLAPQRPTAAMARQHSAEDDDTWGTHMNSDPYSRGPSPDRRPSYELGSEDRAGLLRNSVPPGMRTGVSPARSDLDQEVEDTRFNKEAGIDEQYRGYGRYSWGKNHGV